MITYGNQVLKIEDYKITHDFYGRDTLSFTIPLRHEQHKDIVPLMTLHCRDDNQRYTVRKIDTVDVVAELDLTDLQSRMYAPYKSQSTTAASIISSVIPEYWQVVDNTGLSNRKTIELESATPLEIIEEVCNQFEIAVRYDNSGDNMGGNYITLVNPAASTVTSAYFTDELNLRSLATTVTTDNYATRLYAYGADGLSFKDINGGKEYVDASAGGPVVSAYWSDDRYTVKEHLLEAAKKKVEEMATPRSAYELSVVDLAKTRPEEYGFLEVHLYDRVPLLDRVNKRRAVHQVVQYVEHPNYPDKNEIVLSTVPRSIQKTVKRITNTVDNVTRTDGSLVAAKLAGFINGANASLRAQYNVAEKQDVLAILFENLDPESEMFGALAIGTQGILISKQRNADNTGWVWTTAINYAGIIADTVVTGLLSDKSGRSYWNLETGELQLSGKFRQYDTSGRKSVDILDNQLNVYSWETNGDYLGSIGAVKYLSSGENCICLYSDVNSPVVIGAKKSDGNVVKLADFYIDKNGNSQIGLFGSVNFNGLAPFNNVTNLKLLNGSNGVYLEIGNGSKTWGVDVWASDKRLKKSVKKSKVSALDQVKKIPHHSFIVKDSGEEVKCGYVAQELEEINPEFVLKVTQPDGSESYQVRAQAIIPILTRAIQELGKKIEGLETRLSSIEKSV